MVVCDTARYKNSPSPSTDGLNNGGFAKYSLRLWEAASYSFVQWKVCLRVLKNGRHLLVSFETNLFNVAAHPVGLCTSLTILREVMSSIALTFSRFASISHCDTMKPRNFPDETLKVHSADWASFYTFSKYQTSLGGLLGGFWLPCFLQACRPHISPYSCRFAYWTCG